MAEKFILQYLDCIKLNADGKTSVIEIVKVGKIHGRGITITDKMLDDYIANFEKKTYRTDLQVNLRHDREGQAAGWIKKLYKESGVLFAEVEWTPLGVNEITSKQFRYTSSELSESYTDPVTGLEHKNVLIGVALTNIPQVKGMAPVSLSEGSLYSESYVSFLNSLSMKDKVKAMYDGLMKKEEVTKDEMSAFAAAVKEAGDDVTPEDAADMKKKLSAKAKKLSEGEEEEKEEVKEEKDKEAAEEKAKELAEKTTGKTVKLSEFERVSKLAEETAKKNTLLQERLDRTDLKEKVSNELMLSEETKVGFIKNDENLSEVVDFMMSLSQEQRDKFCELVGKVQSVDLSVVGGAGAKLDPKQSKEDAAIKDADAKAAALAEKTGRPLADCLSEVYRGLDLAKV